MIAPVKEIVKDFDKRIADPIKPMLVSSGPFKENINVYKLFTGEGFL